MQQSAARTSNLSLRWHNNKRRADPLEAATSRCSRLPYFTVRRGIASLAAGCTYYLQGKTVSLVLETLSVLARRDSSRLDRLLDLRPGFRLATCWALQACMRSAQVHLALLWLVQARSCPRQGILAIQASWRSLLTQSFHSVGNIFLQAASSLAVHLQWSCNQLVVVVIVRQGYTCDSLFITSYT